MEDRQQGQGLDRIHSNRVTYQATSSGSWSILPLCVEQATLSTVHTTLSLKASIVPAIFADSNFVVYL